MLPNRWGRGGEAMGSGTQPEEQCAVYVFRARGQTRLSFGIRVRIQLLAVVVPLLHHLGDLFTWGDCPLQLRRVTSHRGRCRDHLRRRAPGNEDARGSGKGPGTPFRGAVTGRVLFCQLHLYLWYPFDSKTEICNFSLSIKLSGNYPRPKLESQI